MDYAQPDETDIGERVLVPLEGEHMYEEQICLEYTVVKALQAPDGTLTIFPKDHAIKM